MFISKLSGGDTVVWREMGHPIRMLFAILPSHTLSEEGSRLFLCGSYTWQSGHFSLIFLPMPVAVPPVPVPMTTMSTCPPHWARISSAVVS
jgi:hypothetical protein